MLVKVTEIEKIYDIKHTTVYKRLFNYNIPMIKTRKKGLNRYYMCIDKKYIKYLKMMTDKNKIEMIIDSWIESIYRDNDIRIALYNELNTMDYGERVKFCIKKKLI